MREAIAILFNPTAQPPALDDEVTIRECFSRYSMAYGQLALIKRIYPSIYKKIYNYTTLVDQNDDQPLKLTLMNVVESGRTIMNVIKHNLIPLLENESRALAALRYEDFRDLERQVKAITDPISELIEMKTIVVEALFSEFAEAITVLVQFTLNGQQTHE